MNGEMITKGADFPVLGSDLFFPSKYSWLGNNISKNHMMCDDANDQLFAKD